MTESTTAREPRGIGTAEPGAATYATPAGTRRFAARFAGTLDPAFFRGGFRGLQLSSIGLGTYLGTDSEADDAAYAAVVRGALARGINVVDTAINYRCQRSERVIGKAIATALNSGDVGRDEVVVCTKGGYVPLDECPPNTAEGYKGYLRREFFGRRIMTPGDLVAGGHSLAPRFIEDCMARSRRNLGLATIDLYYVHNPEQQLAAVSYAELLGRMRAVFELLESKVASGEIRGYGCATWQGFRAPPGDRQHLSMRDLVAVAREVGGEGHGFVAVQMPLNLAMGEALRLPTQPLGPADTLVPAIRAACELGLTVVTSAPIMQGQLARNLPRAVQDAIPGCRTDAQRALTFARGAPGVSTSLVGMRSLEHLSENMEKVGPAGG